MRLIDADAIQYDQLLKTGYKEHPIEWAVSQSLIDSTLTIEAEPIKHGHNLIGDTLFECSEWGYYNDDITRGTTRIFNYCPNCGAKMDLPKEEQISE